MTAPAPPKELNAIADVILAYRPPPKSKPAKKRKRRGRARRPARDSCQTAGAPASVVRWVLAVLGSRGAGMIPAIAARNARITPAPAQMQRAADTLDVARRAMLQALRELLHVSPSLGREEAASTVRAIAGTLEALNARR